MESCELLLTAIWRCLLLTLLMLAVPSLVPGETTPSATAKIGATKAGATKAWATRWQPASLVNGAPVLFTVAPPVRLTSLSATWLEHEVLFSYDAASKAWYGIAGVSLQTRPGTYSLELKGTTSRAAEISFSRKIMVRAAKYPSIAVTVAKQYTQPSKEQLERIRQDKTVKQDVFHHTDPEREWSGKFRPPVEAAVSDIFGTRRTFNGKVQSMHQGLDYAVPTGTPVAGCQCGDRFAGWPVIFRGQLRGAGSRAGTADPLSPPFRSQSKTRGADCAGPGDRTQRRHGPGYRASFAFCGTLGRHLHKSSHPVDPQAALRLGRNHEDLMSCPQRN